jgi:hypothetical protein
MAAEPIPPAEATGGFDPPPSAAMAIQNRKEVTWNPSTKPKYGKTTELRLFPVKLQLAARLSVTAVLKEILTRFLVTDPRFYLVSKINADVIIRTVTEFNALSNSQVQQLFPGKVIRGQTNIRFFMASSMDIARLKQSSYGFYEFAGNTIWLKVDVFESNDIRSIGFITRKDINRTDKNIFEKELTEKLLNFEWNMEDNQRLEEAKDNLSFPNRIPNMEIRLTKSVAVNTPTGRVSTSALTVHCDSLHMNFLTKLITRYYEEASNDERFVPHSMLNGRDPDYIASYRNAIVYQNQFLQHARVLPVIGLHPKAMAAMIQLDDGEESQVYSYIRRYQFFTSIEATQLSDKLGKYLFMTTEEHFLEAKKFITDTLPKIWQKIDNTFLEELPASVRCPRLTNSNLRDESTKRTVALLAEKPPDDYTIASKWSSPPQLNKPPATISVNYSDNNYPALQKKGRKRKTAVPKDIVTDETIKTQDPIDASSNHSKSTTASAGTAFTREDAKSLVTEMTGSILTDWFEKQEARQAAQDAKQEAKEIKQATEKAREKAQEAEDKAKQKAEDEIKETKREVAADRRMFLMMQQFLDMQTSNPRRTKTRPSSMEIDTDYTSEPPIDPNKMETSESEEEYPFSDPTTNPNCAANDDSDSTSDDDDSAAHSIDKIKSQTQTHGSPDKSALAKFRPSKDKIKAQQQPHEFPDGSDLVKFRSNNTFTIISSKGARSANDLTGVLTKPEEPEYHTPNQGTDDEYEWKDQLDEPENEATTEQVTENQGTDDEYEWNDQEVSEPRTSKPTKISPEIRRIVQGRGRGGRGSGAPDRTTRRPTDESVATVLEGDHQSLSTVESDGPSVSKTSPASKPLPASPSRKEETRGPADTFFDQAIEFGDNPDRPTSAPESSEDLRWNVVPTNSKRKAKALTAKLDPLQNRVRKDDTQRPPAKKLFVTPATPKKEDEPARKK